MRSVKFIQLILGFLLVSEVTNSQSSIQVTEGDIFYDGAITNDSRFAIYANGFYLVAIFNYLIINQFSMFEV